MGKKIITETLYKSRNTTIQVSQSNHKRILELKFKDRLSSVNDVITDLLKTNGGKNKNER